MLLLPLKAISRSTVTNAFPYFQFIVVLCEDWLFVSCLFGFVLSLSRLPLQCSESQWARHSLAARILILTACKLHQEKDSVLPSSTSK